MSLALNATLQAAQDSLERRPIIELMSTQFEAAIPFEGQYFNSEITDEEFPAMVTMTNGSLAAIYVKDNDQIQYLRTDVDRVTWSDGIVYSAAVNRTIEHVSLCELGTGNIGIIFIENLGSATYYIKRMVISLAGAVVHTAVEIASYAVASFWVSAAFVVSLANSNFLMVYAHKNKGTGIYSIMKRTAISFAGTWSAESAISLGGGLLASRRKGAPSLLQVTSGDILLLFDYVDDLRADGSEIVNIYYCVSADNGVSWSGAIVITTYSDFGEGGFSPVAAEISNGTQIKLVFHEGIAVRHMDKDSTGWQSCIGAFCNNTSYGTDIHYDPTTGKLYVKQIHTYVGNKVLCGVVVIDVDSWTVEKVYTNTSLPAYSDAFLNNHVWYHRHHGEGKYVSFAITEVNGVYLVGVINHDTETIVQYLFNNDWAAYGLTKNIEMDFRGSINETYAKIRATWVDAASERLYVMFSRGYAYGSHVWFGYIDLTEVEDPVSGFTWHEVFYSTDYTEAQLMLFNSMLVVPDMNYVVFAFGGTISTWKGRLTVHSLTSGGMLYDYNPDDFPGFAYRGARYPAYHDGHIYASFNYESSYGNADRRGLMDITLATNAIMYHRPSWATLDNYKLWTSKSTGDGRIILNTLGYGITIFTISGGTWERFNNTNLAGMTPDGDDYFYGIDYDSASKTIFAGCAYKLAWKGILAFSEYGDFKKGYYSTGTPAWTFSTPAPLVQRSFDYDFAMALDPNDVLWVIWTRQDGEERSNQWDHDSTSFDFSSYLVTGSAVKINWSIDRTSKLTFSVTHGHLFDPNNLMSSWSIFTKKGRRVKVQIGERVAGVDYWQDQGTFVLAEVSLQYKRGEYPTMQISCEDLRRVWNDGKIIASQYYDTANPEDVLEDLVTTHGGLISADVDLPSPFDNTHTLHYQFLDQSLVEMIELILDHFGYFPYMTVDGKFTARRLSVTKSADHIYGDTFAIINFTPDDSYSTFTNRVVVVGEGRYFLEVLYNEESVGSLGGTCGWWGRKNVERVWYSEDHERTCRDPRLEILQSVKEFSIFRMKGGGKEFISTVDFNEQWMEITIEAPNLMALFVASAAAVVTVGILALSCELDCGYYVFGLSLLCSALFYILGSVASYSYNVWAKPIGHEKQTFQATANDLELQRELNGLIVMEEIEDSLAYEIGHCQVVADNEMAIVIAQRRRVNFSKIAHLQDEVGDVLQIVHPYSGVNLKVLAVELTRSFVIPSFPSSEGGGVTDSITGWRLL